MHIVRFLLHTRSSHINIRKILNNVINLTNKTMSFLDAVL